jgi:hypothetical protein
MAGGEVEAAPLADSTRAQAFTREETYSATRRPVTRAQTLIADAYTSEAFHALERERVFTATHPESTAKARSEDAIERLAAFWDRVNREDIEIVERVQQGLSTTPFPGGRLCYRFEEPLHRFQNMIIDRMVGVRRVPSGDERESAPLYGPC